MSLRTQWEALASLTLWTSYLQRGGVKETLRASARASSFWLSRAAVQSEKQDQASDRPQSLEMMGNPEVLLLEEFFIHRREGPFCGALGPTARLPTTLFWRDLSLGGAEDLHQLSEVPVSCSQLNPKGGPRGGLARTVSKQPCQWAPVPAL